MMENFTLNLCNGTVRERFDGVLNLKRKCQSISVTLDRSNELLVQILCTHGTQIRKLVFNQKVKRFTVPFFPRFIQDFNDILSNVPYLVEIELNDLKFNDDMFPIEKIPVTLRNLKKLTINRSYWHLFEFFMESPIRELTIHSDLMYEDSDQYNAYIRFLEASDKLESIELDDLAYCYTFHLPLRNTFRFKLKKIKCLKYINNTAKDEDLSQNFSAFLESQGSSLKELEFRDVPSSTIKTIFTKLNALEKLTLNFACLPSHKEYYDQLRTVATLTKLEMNNLYGSYGTISHDQQIKGILSKCPNLEDWEGPYCYDTEKHNFKLLPFIATHNPKIRILAMPNFSMLIPLEAKFPHLEELLIHGLINFEFLVAFLSINATTVKTLELWLSQRQVIPNDTIVEALLDRCNLHHLVIGADANMLEAIHINIKTEYKQLKSLELHEMFKDKKIVIKFPQLTR